MLGEWEWGCYRLYQTTSGKNQGCVNDFIVIPHLNFESENLCRTPSQITTLLTLGVTYTATKITFSDKIWAKQADYSIGQSDLSKNFGVEF